MENVLTARLNKPKFIEAYLRIWNGGLQLTDKEFEVAVEILKLHDIYTEAGVQEPVASEMIFQPKNIKAIKDKLDVSKQSWNNYKTKLIEKKVLLSNNDLLIVNPMLIPKTELTFKFEII